VEYAHKHGVQADWYFNNCYCADSASGEQYFQGDVNFLIEAGLDGVKIDGCGGERNIGLYQSLLNETSTNFLIQDCTVFVSEEDSAAPHSLLESTIQAC
jgi:hypothetical protein